MDKDKRKSFLELQIVWKDEHMFELKITASNVRYSATTEVYNTKESLQEFAQTLFYFPKDSREIVYTAGTRNEYAFFSMRFYCLNSTGHIGVEINLEDNVATEFRQEEKSKAQLEIIVEPSAIINFQKQLSQLALKQAGNAILFGRDNWIAN
jgi:hypothetical protein